MAWTVEWWAYSLVALTVFFSCILLNYIVNKINEAQLEERLLILHLKNPVGRVIQAQEPTLGMEIEKPGRSLINTKTNTIMEIKIHETQKQPKEILFSSEVKTPVFLGSIYRSPKDAHIAEVANVTEVLELADFTRTTEISEEPNKSEVYGRTKENDQKLLSNDVCDVDNNVNNLNVKTIDQTTVLLEPLLSNNDCEDMETDQRANNSTLPNETKKTNME